MIEKTIIEAVIFDIDGTIVDSVDLHARAWQRAFEKFGKKIPLEAICRQIGKGADQLLPVFFSKRELEEFGEEMEAYRGELFKKEYLPSVKGFPKVRELFERIRRDKKRIALAAEAAAKAHMNSVGLLCGGWTQPQLSRAGCIAVYRDPADLLARYEESPLVQLNAQNSSP